MDKGRVKKGMGGKEGGVREEGQEERERHGAVPHVKPFRAYVDYHYQPSSSRLGLYTAGHRQFLFSVSICRKKLFGSDLKNRVNNYKI
jgi:hypothetical protein